MTPGEKGATATRAGLQRAFDASFAQAPAIDDVPQVDLLTIRIGADPYAIDLADVSEVLADRHVTRLPSPVRELMGVVSTRGTILPVYDLRALLGFKEATTALRWLLVTAGTPVCLSFDQLEGRLRAPREAIVSDRDAGGRVHQVVNTDGFPRPVLHLPSVLDTIGRLARQRAHPRSDER